MPNPTRKYICDLRIDAVDAGITVPAILAEHPAINLFVENHFADPAIDTGRVRCTVSNVSIELHDQIMSIPGTINVT